MQLENLLSRAQEIEQAIINATNQLTALAGHKQELAHWIQQHLLKQDETQVEVPVEAVVD